MHCGACSSIKIKLSLSESDLHLHGYMSTQHAPYVLVSIGTRKFTFYKFILIAFFVMIVIHVLVLICSFIGLVDKAESLHYFRMYYHVYLLQD